MEPSNTPLATRRSEDIALDLLKFLASHANVGNKSAATTPGFGTPSAAKSEDQITQLLDLYSRCRQAVEEPLAQASASPAASKK